MTLESTLAALLREQRETNALLRRLVEAKTGVAVTAPATVWAVPLNTCESPATRGDGHAIRVGWQGNGMVGP